MIEALWPPKPKLLLMAASESGRSRGVIRRVVEIAVGIGVVVVDRRRHDAVAHAPAR